MSLRALALAVGLAAVCTSPAVAAPPGTLVITERKIDTSPESFEKEVKAATRTSVARSGDHWKIYFVAYLNKPPGAEEINIVFYEEGGKSRDPVNHYPIRTSAKAKILVSEVDIKPEDGFKAGNKYSVRITRLIGGKEVVYARTTVQLTD